MAQEPAQPSAMQGIVIDEPVLFEMGSPGRMGYSLNRLEEGETSAANLLPAGEVREEVEGLPELTELDIVRHFTRLSQWNFSVDGNFYPLGSCTMKYNPKLNEDMARLDGFAGHHPLAPAAASQGSLQLMFELQEYLKEISGMDHVTLQPAAGAQGEMTGILLIHACLTARGNPRKKVLMPDSAHGTNPASSALCGYHVVHIPSNDQGLIDPAQVERLMDEDTAAIMLTNPNTLGMFEKDIMKITGIVHDKGGLVYCDGANLNALMGITRIGDMDIDVLHFNLHKTFSTPHGGGGPGAGPVGVKKIFEPYLPVPVVEKSNEGYRLNHNRPQTIGKVKNFFGNFGMLVRAYTYIRSLGPEGIRRISEMAVLNANYIKASLKEDYHLPYPGDSLHEVVFNDKVQLNHEVKTTDIAKALIDFGFHPPTIYFPLIVKGALMIEPTESESKDTLDGFIEAMKNIAGLAQTEPEEFASRPHFSKVSRPDEAGAARRPRLRWIPS